MPADFSTRSVGRFDDFCSAAFDLPRKGGWLYRGQGQSGGLKTSFERSLAKWDINLERALQIERSLIRDFRRRYEGSDKEVVLQDTCYCLALMQHYSAPTRMLDWTYSPFVAAKFALDAREYGGGVVWCVREDWLDMEVRNVMPPDDIDRWNSKRNDETFCKLFLQEGPSKQFIYTANPFSLNERLKVQQGVFTCHGDITRSFADNLTAMSGWEQSENVLRICLTLEHEELYEFAERLLRMNLDSASLFQGSDGLGRSLGDRMFLFAKLAVASAPGT